MLLGLIILLDYQTFQRIAPTARRAELVSERTKEQPCNVLLVYADVAELVKKDRLAPVALPVVEDSLCELRQRQRLL